MKGVKHGNEYARVLGRLYARTPKSVLAAVAVALAHKALGEPAEFEGVADVIATEWAVLNANGIVPQSPPKDFTP